MNYDGLKNDGLFFCCVGSQSEQHWERERAELKGSGKIINKDSSKYVFSS